MSEGSLEVKLPTIWADGKAEAGRVREKRRVEEKESEERSSDARKGRKVAKHCVFPMICGSGGSKSRLAKAAGAEPSGQMRNEKVLAVVARSTFRSKMYKTHHARSTFRSWDAEKVPAKMLKTPRIRATFRSWDVEKVHAVVARSTFRSQNVKSTTDSDHFWTFRCRFAWQAQGIVHLVKSEQNVRVLGHFQKPWQAWGISRGSAKMPFPWQTQYKRHLHQSC